MQMTPMPSTLRHPCPYCGRLYTLTFRAERGVREGSVIKCRDIEDHDCPSFRREPGNLWESK
jgi:hypothetical protein